MMFGKCKNTKIQGDVGVGIAISWFVSDGYVVSIPLTDSQDYDLVVEKDGILARVQVKTTSYKRKEKFIVSLTVKGGNRTSVGKIKSFSPDRVELIFVVTSDGDKYLFDVDNSWTNNSLTLGEKYDKFMVT